MDRSCSSWTGMLKANRANSIKYLMLHDDDFLSALSAPARRALENRGITTLAELAKYTQAEILQLHGMGPASIPKLKKALQEKKLDFKKAI